MEKFLWVLLITILLERFIGLLGVWESPRNIKGGLEFVIASTCTLIFLQWLNYL